MAEASACLADSSLGPKASESWREGAREREGGERGRREREGVYNIIFIQRNTYTYIKLVRHAQYKIIIKSFNCKNTAFHVIFW